MRFDATLWKERAPAVAAALLFFLANFVYFLAGRAVDASRAESLSRQRQQARARGEAAEQTRQKAAADLVHVQNVRKAAEEFYGRRIGTIDRNRKLPEGREYRLALPNEKRLAKEARRYLLRFSLHNMPHIGYTISTDLTSL